ncbi:geranylgeranyl transferas-like protein type i beta subunit [Sporormia fimetaria CBS 119925]|uniref:Geranylgeranyl transferas-like protein type i beta subunit n=1 Tax=Sporormia fimetaria CBS 119925 TaxID=1340428 RepID=A0A6A6VGF2_9PLEO|nr:geranylgeranyl transferas-like protein type i beta subunit [Sporormia fimetaria CBS 119925]
MAPDAEESGILKISKHVSYWRRNLKTYLPHHYTGTDSNRMLLAFFILSALDLLGDLDAALTDEERHEYVEWVYNCQIPDGGFRPSPGTYVGTARNQQNAVWDPAHIPGTFFSLLVLVLLGDDLKRVKRKETLIWLNRMQRPDGSFGETIGQAGRVEGGNDTRFGYMATGIRWILRGDIEGHVDDVPDIDVDKFVQCVRDSETYDGGISEAPFHEAHAGFACCAVSALALLDRLPVQTSQQKDQRLRGITDLPSTLHWLVSRQTLTLEEGEEDEGEQNGDANPSKGAQSQQDLSMVGMNGRCNKIADTCYAYWVCAPLDVLGHLHLVDTQRIRLWLLDMTQHFIGGFGKLPGDPPDIYHSYLGLFTLAMFGEPRLKEADAALCISKAAKERIESLPWRKAIVEQKI